MRTLKEHLPTPLIMLASKPTAWPQVKTADSLIIKSRKIRITIAQVRIDIQFATLYPADRGTFSELQFIRIAGTLNVTCMYANYYWRLTKFPPTIICMISCWYQLDIVLSPSIASKLQLWKFSSIIGAKSRRVKAFGNACAKLWSRELTLN